MNVSMQAENFQKMLTLNDDVRVILIKIADRLHNMQTMESMEDYKQVKNSFGDFIYLCSLAHRLVYTILKQTRRFRTKIYRASNL
jgi:GTP pyrophosphokinase